MSRQESSGWAGYGPVWGQNPAQVQVIARSIVKDEPSLACFGKQSRTLSSPTDRDGD